MSEIISRAIHISNGTPGLMVMFSWFESDKPKGHQYSSLVLENCTNLAIDELRNRLNRLGVTWYIAEMSERRFSVIGDFPQALYGLFDQAVMSGDPLTALITPYEIVIQPHIEEVSV